MEKRTMINGPEFDYLAQQEKNDILKQTQDNKNAKAKIINYEQEKNIFFSKSENITLFEKFRNKSNEDGEKLPNFLLTSPLLTAPQEYFDLFVKNIKSKVKKNQKHATSKDIAKTLITGLTNN